MTESKRPILPAPASPPPPAADRRLEEKTVHGTVLTDLYQWLRDPGYPNVTDEAILGYLNRENAYFEEVMEPRKPLIDALFEELKGRIKDDDSSVPVKDGDYIYWRRFEPGAQYRTWLRRPADGPEDAEQVILDEPMLAEGLEYFRLRAAVVSPDAGLLAWASDTDGSERYTIRVNALARGDQLPDEIPNTSGGVVWTAAGDRFFYVELSEQLRPFRVKLHKLGEDPAKDTVIYEETDNAYFVGIGESQSRRFVEIGAGDHVTSEIRLIPADDPLAEPMLIAPRDPGVEYDVAHAGDFLFIRTNDTHKNSRLARAPLAAPGRENWVDLLPGEDGRYLRGVEAFKGFLVLSERIAGIDRLRLMFHENGEITGEHVIEFDEDVYTAGLGENPEFDVDTIQVGYTSMVTPSTVYDFDVTAKVLTERKVQEIPSGYDKSDYVTERVTVTARDGAQVPISIVHGKNFKRDGSQPLHLYGYGAYGLGMPPAFSTNRLSLLKRGFAFAIAHIRGGDELGYGWYEAGKLMDRKNTFNDFIDCARALEDQGYAAPGGISISGGSAGGTLMGVALNEAPDLWRAAVAHVPFVDVMNTMLDDTLPLTPIEWPEWGNPITDKDAFDCILDYSPYENVKPQDYPPILITAGLSDPRVTYWEPAKWAAKLRAEKTDSNVLMLKTNMGAGHGGKSGRYESLHETAEEYAFLLMAFGLA